MGRARNGEGPTLIEAMTFRLQGHSLGDDSHYMAEGELQNAIENDPVPALRGLLLEQQHATEEQLTELEEINESTLNEAIEFAYASDYPDVSENRIDVFKEEVESDV